MSRQFPEDQVSARRGSSRPTFSWWHGGWINPAIFQRLWRYTNLLRLLDSTHPKRDNYIFVEKNSSFCSTPNLKKEIGKPQVLSQLGGEKPSIFRTRRLRRAGFQATTATAILRKKRVNHLVATTGKGNGPYLCQQSNTCKHLTFKPPNTKRIQKDDTANGHRTVAVRAFEDKYFWNYGRRPYLSSFRIPEVLTSTIALVIFQGTSLSRRV